MKLYEIKITFELSEEDKARAVNFGDEFQSPDEVPEIEGTFHIGAKNLIDATMTAQEYSTGAFPNGFELLSVTELPEIFLANWPEEDDPFDFDESTPPEEMMLFTCLCGEEISARNNKWEYLQCPECEKIIDRNHVIENKGKFLLIESHKED